MPRVAEDRWLSLGRACEVLGVNETTLRHWANTGRVRAFRTPGGHRRFSREDLNGLIEVATTNGNRTSANAASGPTALERMRRRIGHRKGHDERWLMLFDDEGRARMRILGRRVVTLTTEYVMRKRKRAELQEEARHLGIDYGRELATHSVGLADAISAFIFFRNSLHGALGQDSDSAEKANDLRSMVDLEDLVLLGIASVYETEASLATALPQRTN